ncbi:hypothetical protein A2V71_00715 [Candidatus Berkelbacteria bacterium RBG_13_40_8]|uniref:PsbP C-terminal domain-containing protein n=1 Tax=Candidatus Berkelbacteria bacterium RBG_13_40_8 TaxID=1797467 RepID=A0A1F5DQ84_9BACT|nr:MAG: hypothetical protein A2V71_00715 [Candidatus Berkelbacteria bacterium RBG_13_40_8]
MNPANLNVPPSPEWNPAGAKKKTGALKWLLTSLVIVVLGAAAFFYYVYIYKKAQPTTTTTPDTSETANWQTYKNTIYGYSLKYPEGWEVDEKDVADVKFSKKPKDATLASDQKILFEVKSASTGKGTKTADWVKDELKDTPYSAAESLLGGKEAITITQTSDQTQEVFLIADDTKYRLLQAEGTKEDFGKIVKTFKLIARETTKTTNTTTSTDILSQTYTNENYGYSVKYPGEWVAKDMNATKEEHVLDQIGFQPTAASDTIAFSVKVTDRTVDNEVTLYKAGLDTAKLTAEIDASLGGYSGKKITSIKGSVETAAIFLQKGGDCYIISGEVKNPAATYKLYFDQMVASFQFI